MTALTTDQLDELEGRARRATRGSWKLDEEHPCDPRVCDGECGEPDPGSSHRDCYAVVDTHAHMTTANAAHIAANSPDVTLKLVAIARAALAWSEARSAYDAAAEHCEESNAALFEATGKLEQYRSAETNLTAALLGTP